MSWELLCKILILTIVGGLTASGVAIDIIGRIYKGRMELANLAVKAAQSHMATYHTPPSDKAPWDV